MESIDFLIRGRKFALRNGRVPFAAMQDCNSIRSSCTIRTLEPSGSRPIDSDELVLRFHDCLTFSLVVRWSNGRTGLIS